MYVSHGTWNLGKSLEFCNFFQGLEKALNFDDFTRKPGKSLEFCDILNIVFPQDWSSWFSVKFTISKLVNARLQHRNFEET